MKKCLGLLAGSFLVATLLAILPAAPSDNGIRVFSCRIDTPRPGSGSVRF